MSCPICASEEIAARFSNMFDDRFGCPDTVDVSTCQKCGHSFISPMKPDDQLGDLYSTYYGRESAPEVQRPSRVRSALFRETTMSPKMVGEANGRTLLDVGCGAGEFLLQSKDAGFDVRGYDVDPKAVAAAKEAGLTVECSPSITTAFEGDSFDIVSMNQLIEHTDQPIKLLTQAKDRLSHDGLIFLTTPNGDSYLNATSGRSWINWHVPYHQHIFSPTSLRLAAEQAGLSITHLSTKTPTMWRVLQLRNDTAPLIRGAARWPWRGAVDRARGSDLKDMLSIAATTPTSILHDRRQRGDCLVAVAQAK